MKFLVVALPLMLTSCGEPASVWDSHSGHYRNTDEVRRDEINREIDKRELRREERR